MKQWFTTREQHLVGASLARILVGCGGLHFYLSNYADRFFLFGPHSYVTKSAAPTLYDLVHTNASFDVVFHAGLLSALALAIVGGRALMTAHAVLFWSIWARNPQLFDGGDLFGRIASVVLILAVTDAYLSPLAKRRRGGVPSGRTITLHNVAVAMVIVQIAVVYTSAGVFKVFDPLWRSGTALYRIGQLSDYRFVDWSGVLASPIVVMPLTYGVMFLETTFVLTMRTRYRVFVAASLLLMHIGIAVTMGLVGFAMHMAAGLAICLSDENYARITRRRSGTGSGADRRDAPQPPHRTAPPPASRRRVRSIRRHPLRTPA
jgi:hypothetical protein